MNKYIIRGDHPILKRIDWNAEGLEDMNAKFQELLNAGYEVTVIPDGFINDKFPDMPF